MSPTLLARRFFALAAVLTLAGCAAKPSVQAEALAGTTWLVDRIVETDGSVRRGTGETVRFADGERIALRSCNVCNGTYALRNGFLTISPDLACSRRACAPGTTELERELAGTLALRRDNEYLVLDGGPDSRKVLLLPDNPEEVQPPAPSE